MRWGCDADLAGCIGEGECRMVVVITCSYKYRFTFVFLFKSFFMFKEIVNRMKDEMKKYSINDGRNKLCWWNGMEWKGMALRWRAEWRSQSQSHNVMWFALLKSCIDLSCFKTFILEIITFSRCRSVCRYTSDGILGHADKLPGSVTIRKSHSARNEHANSQ